METNVNYQKIRSLADLREERIRIRYEICLARKGMEEEKCAIRSIFSFDYLLSLIFRKAGWLYNSIIWGESIFNIVRSFFRRKTDQDYEEEVEDDCSCPE